MRTEDGLIEVKSSREIALIKQACQMTAQVLQKLAGLVEPGLSAEILDHEAQKDIGQFPGATAAFLGYRGFPYHVCVSRNAEVVHGFPSKNKVFQEGDLVSLDLGIRYEGYYGDAATTVAVGRKLSASNQRLLETTKRCLDLAMAVIRPGASVGDIGHAVESHAKSNNMNVVRDFVGHGIGRRLHEDPPIPNWGEPGKGVKLVAGMTIAVEPMITLGSGEVFIGSDGWTAKTKDNAWAAHFEHTFVVTEDGCRALTQL